MWILSICPPHPLSAWHQLSVSCVMETGTWGHWGKRRHWPLHILWGRHCFIIFIKIIWVMSWKKNNRNCMDHHPHCQCRRLILFSLSGAECQDTKCLRCKQATQIWQKNKKGASMCKSSGNCVENKKCERSCVYPSLRILTTSLFVYLLFCQLGLQTVEKRKMDRWNNAF